MIFITAVQGVYKRRSYVVLSVLVALVLFVFNIAIVNYQLYVEFPSAEAVKNVFVGTYVSLPWHSRILVVVTALLAGVFASFLAYYAKSMRAMTGSYKAGSAGLVLGVLVPGCSSCGIGLAAVLGLAGTLSALPFGGVELSLLGVVLLGVAVMSLARKIAAKACEVKKKR